ncbi:MAG: STAS domain-containing protein [Chloroflexota bacterium]
MEISHAELKRVDLVTVSGRVDGSTAPELEAGLRGINDGGKFRIVLDLSGLEYISSAGLRVLVSTLKNCRRYNRGDLRLTGLSERVLEVFELAGLDVLFRIYPSAAEAVGSF